MLRPALCLLLLLPLILHSGKLDTAAVNAVIIKLDKRVPRMPDSVLVKADSLARLCEKEDYTRGQIRALTLKGKAEDFAGKYKESLQSFKTAFDLASGANDLRAMASIKQCEGNSHFYAGENQRSLESFIASHGYFTRLKDSLGISSVLMGIANYYYQTKDFKKAILHFTDALNIRQRMGDSAYSANIMQNLAIAYEGDQQFDKAEKLLLQSLEIKKKMNDEVAIAFSYAAIGKHYLNRGIPEKGLPFLKKAMEMRRKFADRYGLANAGLGLGVIYSRLGRYPEALITLREVLENARITQATKIQLESLNELSEIFGKLKKYDSAWHYSRLFTALNDSFMNEDKNKQMSEMQTRFETAEKEKENELLKKDNLLKEEEGKRKTVVIWSVAATGLILLLFGMYSWKAYRQKQRANTLLEIQKSEISAQKLIIEEKNKDITDSIAYAQRIQKALLPGEQFLKKYLKDLFILYKPRDIVSGDFYWSLFHHDHLYIAVADCTGHGVPGAFMSMIGMSLLNEIIVERKIQNPALALDILREEVIRRLNPEGEAEVRTDGMDMVLLRINKERTNLEYAAAFNSLYLVRNGNLVEQKADKMPVGKHEGLLDSFAKHSIALQPEDRIYLFTDGFADQFGGPKGKKFRYSQLEKLITRISPLPMKDQQRELEGAFAEWRKALEQVDDVTGIGLKI